MFNIYIAPGLQNVDLRLIIIILIMLEKPCYHNRISHYSSVGTIFICMHTCRTDMQKDDNVLSYNNRISHYF